MAVALYNHERANGCNLVELYCTRQLLRFLSTIVIKNVISIIIIK